MTVAVDDALDLLDTLLDGFEFDSPLDRSVALAALLTAVVRPRLRTAPVFVVPTALARIAAALALRPATLRLNGAASAADEDVRSALGAAPDLLVLDGTFWTGTPLGGPGLVDATRDRVLARIPGSTRVGPARATILAVGPEPEVSRALPVLTVRFADPGFDPIPRAKTYAALYRDAAEAIAGFADDFDAIADALLDLGLADPRGTAGRLRISRAIDGERSRIADRRSKTYERRAS